jgi:RNA polymerase sigma factor (sigma-70 family)
VDDIHVTDERAIEQLYSELGDRLWWALLAYSGNREIASDAMAEAFARALAAGGTVREPANWVWRVAFRSATAELRASRRHAPLRESAYEMDDEVISVLHAMRRLSDRQRAVSVLFYLDDRPTQEIADLLGMSTATVAVHLHRARARLRSILGDDDD